MIQDPLFAGQLVHFNLLIKLTNSLIVLQQILKILPAALELQKRP